MSETSHGEPIHRVAVGNVCMQTYHKGGVLVNSLHRLPFVEQNKMPSVKQEGQIQRLRYEPHNVLGGPAKVQKVVSIVSRIRRTMSAATIARIRDAQKARWAKWRKAKKTAAQPGQ